MLISYCLEHSNDLAKCIDCGSSGGGRVDLLTLARGCGSDGMIDLRISENNNQCRHEIVQNGQQLILAEIFFD